MSTNEASPIEKIDMAYELYQTRQTPPEHLGRIVLKHSPHGMLREALRDVASELDVRLRKLFGMVDGYSLEEINTGTNTIILSRDVNHASGNLQLVTLSFTELPERAARKQTRFLHTNDTPLEVAINEADWLTIEKSLRRLDQISETLVEDLPE